MTLSWYGLSRASNAAHENQDQILIPLPAAPAPVFGVFDGIGGHVGGNIASAIAKREITAFLSDAPADSSCETLRVAMLQANHAIMQYAASHPGMHRMGTTACLAKIHANQLHACNIGDSRVYVLHHNALIQISEDHSVVWQMFERGELTKDELVGHPHSNLITRALGLEYDLLSDPFMHPFDDADIMLLCTDGLTDVTTDGEIHAHLSAATSLSQCANALYETARKNGSKDDISIVLAAACIPQ